MISCSRCDKHEARPGKKTCSKCAQRLGTYEKKRRARLKEARLCVRCGQAPPEPNYQCCRACLDYQKNAALVCRARRVGISREIWVRVEALAQKRGVDAQRIIEDSIIAYLQAHE